MESPITWLDMPRRKQVYKITYPNGKIYVGMDLTGTALYMGSPSAYERIVADLELDPDRLELTLRKEILWESETATDAEVRAMEMKLIRETGANDPAIGYNKLPRHRPDSRVADLQGRDYDALVEMPTPPGVTTPHTGSIGKRRRGGGGV